MEMRRYMSWEIVEYRDPSSSWHHVLNRTPEGRLIDATGWCNYDPVASIPGEASVIKQWASFYGPAYKDTRDYLTFDVETLLYTLGIHYVTPRGHCVMSLLGLKS